MNNTFTGFILGLVVMGFITQVYPVSNLFGVLDGYCYEKGVSND